MAHNHTAYIIIIVLGAIVVTVKHLMMIFCKKIELRMPGYKPVDDEHSVECNAPDCVMVRANQRLPTPKAEIFFRSKALIDGKHFYFGRCPEHSTNVNPDTTVRVTYEEYIVAVVTDS